MNTDLETRLEAIISCQDTAMARQYEFVEQFHESFPAVAHVLYLFERYPDFDFGSPGPLVHFIETFYCKGYEAELERSLARRPTALTVWLLNRLINGSNGEVRDRYIALLVGVAASTVDEQTRARAADFLSLHK